MVLKRGNQFEENIIYNPGLNFKESIDSNVDIWFLQIKLTGSFPGCIISLSEGRLAEYNTDKDVKFKSVFKRADELMYQNKAAMKNGDIR